MLRGTSVLVELIGRLEAAVEFVDDTEPRCSAVDEEEAATLLFSSLPPLVIAF